MCFVQKLQPQTKTLKLKDKRYRTTTKEGFVKIPVQQAEKKENLKLNTKIGEASRTFYGGQNDFASKQNKLEARSPIPDVLASADYENYDLSNVKTPYEDGGFADTLPRKHGMNSNKNIAMLIEGENITFEKSHHNTRTETPNQGESRNHYKSRTNVSNTQENSRNPQTLIQAKETALSPGLPLLSQRVPYKHDDDTFSKSDEFLRKTIDEEPTEDMADVTILKNISRMEDDKNPSALIQLIEDEAKQISS